MSSYLFDQWEHEKRRLDALGKLHDGDSIDLLARLGVSAGWRCLEVGAGSGGVARWLASRVGDRGKVVATDINPRCLETLAGAGIEVRRHDIAADPLEEREFDLVHARALLQHVPGRDAALAKMVRALRPGGRILLEDIVMPHPATHPRMPAWGKILDALERGLRGVGADPYYGLALPAAMSAAGLRNLTCEARVSPLHSGTETIEFNILSVEQVGPRLLEAGLVTAEDIESVLAAFRTPGMTLTGAIMISVWGMAEE